MAANATLEDSTPAPAAPMHLEDIPMTDPSQQEQAAPCMRTVKPRRSPGKDIYEDDGR
jgi:hypothetical protein